MTITTFFPDVSDFQKGLDLAGVAAVIAKADEGSTWTGQTFAGFRAQAVHLAIPFLAYDFLAVGNVDAQVTHVISTIGYGQPLMLDVEAEAGQPDPQLVDVLAFADRYAALSRGGRVTLAYIPRWYWSGHMGSPSLAPLVARGIGLVSSDYETYSDTGPGWAPYGGVTPAIWQYTDNALVNGQHVDRNAFRGSVDELRALFERGIAMTNPTNPTEAELLSIELAKAAGADRATAHGQPWSVDLGPEYAAFGKAAAAAIQPQLDAFATRLAAIESAIAALSAAAPAGPSSGTYTFAPASSPAPAAAPPAA